MKKNRVREMFTFEKSLSGGPQKSIGNIMYGNKKITLKYRAIKNNRPPVKTRTPPIWEGFPKKKERTLKISDAESSRKINDP